MKKLTPPSEPRPENNARASDESELTEVQMIKSPIAQPEKQHDLPKMVHDYDLKKIKSFKQIRRNYQAKSQKNIFLNDLNVVLDEYLPENHQFDTDLLVHILNISESFFVYGSKTEREEAKSNAVKQLMLKYFRDDEDILDTIITSVWPKVNKSTMIKRAMRRLRLWFKKKHL